MRTEGIIGQRIVQVRQHKKFLPEIGTETDVFEGFVLEDGTVLRAVAIDTEHEILVDFIVQAPPEAPGPQHR